MFSDSFWPASWFLALVQYGFSAPSGSCNEIYRPGWIDVGGVVNGTSKILNGIWNPESLPKIPDENRANQGIPQIPKSPVSDGENKEFEICDAPTTLPGATPHEKPEDPSLRPCEGMKQYLIWPVSCEDSVGNTNKERMLRLMDSNFRISIHHLCAVKGGPSFWLAELVQDQVNTLQYPPEGELGRQDGYSKCPHSV